MLTTADGRHISYDGRDFERMQILAEKDSFGVHSLVDSPDDADVILFVNSAEPNLADVARHPFVRRYRDRVFLHHTGDKIFPVLPGVYPSIDRRWRHFSWAKSGCYPRAVLDGTIPNYSRHLKTPFLYSFVGAVENHPVRRSLVALSSNEGLVIDTSNGGSYCDDERVTRYSNSLRDSLFVLCPRGGGTSSFRLFEAMKAGRIPVIISDRWEPPSGLDWSKFSLQIREADVLRIPEVLSKLRPLACSMCAKSREAWEQWFSPDSYFHRVVQWCGDIRQHQVIPGGLRKIVMTPVIFHPEYFRSFLLSRIRERLKAFDQF